MHQTKPGRWLWNLLVIAKALTLGNLDDDDDEHDLVLQALLI